MAGVLYGLERRKKKITNTTLHGIYIKWQLRHAMIVSGFVNLETKLGYWSLKGFFFTGFFCSRIECLTKSGTKQVPLY